MAALAEREALVVQARARVETELRPLVEQLVEKFTSGPRRILRLPEPAIAVGEAANLTLFNNLTLYGLVDFIKGRTWINGDIRSAHHSFFNTYSAVAGDDDPASLRLTPEKAILHRSPPGAGPAGWATFTRVESPTRKVPSARAAMMPVM